MLDKDHVNYNCTITYSDGTERKIFANWLHNTDQDHWQGWACDTGVTRFYIDKHNQIWDGECKNQLLGNVLESWEPKQQNHCHRERCTGCTDDLLTRKHKI
jgi:hypothetical protein